MGAKVLMVLCQPGRRTLCIRVLAKKGLGRSMSKKKNVKSKKAKTLLRGAVAAGVAIGGADVLGDSNVVYAAEGEFEQFNEGTNEIVVPSYSEQTLSEGAAEALQEQPAVEENAAAAPVETIEQPTEQPAVNVETPENEQVNTVTDSVPAEPAGDVNAVNPEEKVDEPQTPENENQEDVTNPEQESSEGSTEPTESTSGEGSESETESTESTESENSESEAESMESAVSENSESEEVSSEEDESDTIADEESLSANESLSVYTSESLSASIADSLKADAKSEADVDQELSTAERYQVLMAKREAGTLTEEEDKELQSLIAASTSASESHKSMEESLSAEAASASTSLSVEVSQDASTSESVSKVASTSLSTSEVVKESLNLSMSEAVSEAQSEYDSLLEHYNDGEQRLERLEALSKLIKAQEDIVEQKRQIALKRSDKNLYKAGYYTEADKLAELLIQYKMLTEAQVKNYTDVTFSKWEENKDGVDGKYVTATYKDENGEIHKRYFDYVTSDETGEPIENRNETGSWGTLLTHNHENAEKVRYISVVELRKYECF